MRLIDERRRLCHRSLALLSLDRGRRRILEVVVPGFDDAHLFKRAGRNLLHQQIPDQLDEVLPCRSGPGEGRVLIEIMMIESSTIARFHHPIELLQPVRRRTRCLFTVTSTT